VGNERLSVGLRRDDGKRATLVQFGAYGVVIEGSLSAMSASKSMSAISGMTPTLS
jgi:hypothetical protein